MFGFPEGAFNRGLPSRPTIYRAPPPLDGEWPLVWLMVVRFACPVIAPISPYCTVSTFHWLLQFILKRGTFLLCLSGELHVEILSRRIFLPINLWRTQNQSD